MKHITFFVLVLFFMGGCDDGTSADLCSSVVCDPGYACAGATGSCVGLCDDVECDQGFACDPLTGLCAANTPEEGAAACSDGLDNDDDGLTDCDDPGCQGEAVCQGDPETLCDDGVDNDGDGLTDCDDEDCAAACELENTNAACSDGLDNDGDGLTDCDDDDCLQDPVTVCLDPWPNEGWIGGLCQGVEQCLYTDALCLEGEPFGGLCSQACTQYCPDSEEPNNAVTFCVENPESAGEGICVSRCDLSLFPGTGCREGYVCVVKPRFNQSSVSQSVCLPPGDDPPVCTESDVPQPNAGVTAPAGLDGCPQGMQPINGGSVCMDIWEAHLVEITGPGTQVPHSPYFNPGTKVVMAVSAPGAVPQGYINQIQAAAACSQAGKRLCSATEWMLACRTSANYVYPYGNVRQDGWCNDARSPHPVVEYFGTSDAWIWSELGHPCINQLHDSLDLTGANPQCVTSEGFFDLMGNLHEWIDDPAGTFKGGYYVDTVINGEGCLYQTTAHNTSHWDYSTGFRCCADR
ncbi:SUMF1/EgtB/PvdO family nonheme iron enzyme [Myxococcota bacterium]|nr:SUMF1/EgtB/PvdO family nonheme iron enzyme [Myxococcota bacterium]